MMQFRTIVGAALVGTLALAPATAAWAQAQDVSGRIERFEPGSRTLYFRDGRIVTLSPGARLWVDGREVPLETLRRGMNVVVREERPARTARGEAGVLQAHPPVTASGTVARIDSDSGVVTFQDGRSLKLGPGGQVWTSSSMGDIQPGDAVLLQNARPTGYSAMGSHDSTRMRMGRAIQVDGARSLVLLDDGTWVQVSPRTRMRLNGQETRTQTAIVPGDELIIVVGETPSRSGGGRSAVPAGRSAGQPQQASPSGDPSAMPREGLVDQWDTVHADEVHIFRRHQSP